MKLYNTETKQKSDFVPIDPGHVTMYVCGPTVWNHAHIGNYRPPVVFDVLARVLRAQFPKLTYARNITDIDDKINEAAAQEGVDISTISERYTLAYHEGLSALGVLPPDIEPKVTEHVGEIHQQIQSLIDRGHAYVAEAHVLFDVPSFKAYGELSKRKPDELLAGARVDVATYKKNDGDFVLWKPSDDDQPGWDSPWGRGRPGWHIECTAMAATHLGETIDIHGGGHDLIFPHHENERAQSMCAHAAPFVNYWLHNGFVNVNQEKMSKSIGNVLLVKDLLEQVDGEAIRYVLLSAHYRAPLDWSDDVLQQAVASLDRLYGALRKVENIEPLEQTSPQAFIDALHDDLNTPKALAELFALAKQVQISEDPSELAKLKGQILACGQLLGILAKPPKDWFCGDVDAELVNRLVALRDEAKKSKDWPAADKLRGQLSDLNVVLEDSAVGTTWRIEK